MFEDSLFASQSHVISPGDRWTAAFSLTVQVALALLLVALPLFHLETLPTLRDRTRISIPPPLAPPPPKSIVQKVKQATEPSTPTNTPVARRAFTAPRTLPIRIDASSQPDAPVVDFRQMGSTLSPGDLAGSSTTTRARVAITVEPEKKRPPTRVSGGVSAGQLLTPIQPVYPPIAKITHVEGAVIVEALISKTGTIESLRVVSGPATLQAAAIEAIRSARYRPFKLNGEPTEVQTTITINFRMGG